MQCSILRIVFNFLEILKVIDCLLIKQPILTGNSALNRENEPLQITNSGNASRLV